MAVELFSSMLAGAPPPLARAPALEDSLYPRADREAGRCPVEEQEQCQPASPGRTALTELRHQDDRPNAQGDEDSLPDGVAVDAAPVEVGDEVGHGDI